ncbi:hypothetical protein F2Q69_00000061 [Brassica cretica]|uniref:Protein kinase domain-containing protein n=1 Tax=Brassica cretica TaxID=69181 RepID=A0A8S9NTQ7_BRACR|nr:hypothetical protein F2Q69_00000061 [Brassica cretica]
MLEVVYRVQRSISRNLALTVISQFQATNPAKVSDYGLAPIIGSASAPNRFDSYRAPEFPDASKISQKADAYRIGVLILETTYIRTHI